MGWATICSFGLNKALPAILNFRRGKSAADDVGSAVDALRRAQEPSSPEGRIISTPEWIEVILRVLKGLCRIKN